MASVPAPEGPGRDAGRRLCAPDLLRQASRIAAQQILDSQAELGAASVAEGRKLSSSAGEDLYGGLPGLALLWAAMARSAAGDRAADAERCLQALASPRQLLAGWLADERREPSRRIRLGGMCGLGGLIYALTCAGAWLGETALLDEAVAATALVTPRLVARDRRFDVVDGSAGTLLSLLSLAETLRSHGSAPEAPLAAARLCARHLLEQFGNGPSGAEAWETSNGETFCGFAHGAAGILHALLRVHAWEEDPAILRVVRRALAFERRQYRPDLGNWAPFPGFAQDGKPMVSWCWGAPGILLSRIAALPALALPEVQEDIRDGLRATLAQPPTLEDHVCCGNLGRAQILVYAARRLRETGLWDSEALLAAADRLAYGVLRRAKGRGSFGGSARSREAGFQPFFFKGVAGIAYAFLYLAEPASLPLPLLLEAPPAG
jgi:lantibiotic modifying enzyme